jgi:MYXO-CTERM domain-containing protein
VPTDRAAVVVAAAHATRHARRITRNKPHARRTVMTHSFKLSLQSSLLVLSFGATPVWALDFVNAQAFQNLDPIIVTDNNTGLSAIALKEYSAAGQLGSAASTSRTSTQVTAYGYGTSTLTHYDAISSTRSQFVLWDLASNSALPSAAGLGLTFNFTLSGYFDVGATSLSSAGFSYEAELRNGINSVSQERLATVGSTYGPGPGGLQYANTGDLSLIGNFVQNFSLQQTVGELYGTLFLSSTATASNNSQVKGGLNLNSITLTTGVAPAGGLGVWLSQTGQIIPVSPVPEASTWAMWLAGAAAMGFMRRRRTA